MKNSNLEHLYSILADLKHLQSIFATKKELFVYHYIFKKNEKYIKEILRSGELLPVDYIKNKEPALDKYEDREGFKDVNDELEYIYDEFYKPVLKKPYSNYGIYFTTVDLFAFPNDTVARFKVPISRLKGDNIVQLRKSNITKPEDAKDFKHKIEELQKDFNDVEKVEKIYNVAELKFQKLPQIVNFSGSVKVSKADLEYRSV